MIISDSACAPCLLLLPCLCFACLSQSRLSCEVFALVSGYDSMLRDPSPGCMASFRILLVSVLFEELINHLFGDGKRMTGLQSLRSNGLKGGSELAGSNCLLSSRAGAAQEHFLNSVNRRHTHILPSDERVLESDERVLCQHAKMYPRSVPRMNAEQCSVSIGNSQNPKTA